MEHEVALQVGNRLAGQVISVTCCMLGAHGARPTTLQQKNTKGAGYSAQIRQNTCRRNVRSAPHFHALCTASSVVQKCLGEPLIHTEYILSA